MSKQKIALTEADILRRLQQSQITKQSQFIKIIKNLRAQGERLSQDLQMLREKVKELKQRHKRKLQQQSKRIRNNPNKQYIDVRQQLNAKYSQLLIWQKKSQKSKQKLAIQVQYRDYINKCMSLQIQIQTQLKILRTQKKNYKRLKKLLKAQQKQEFHILRKPTQIQQFNRQLKQKISTMKKIVASQNNSQIQIHQHKIQMKEKSKQKKGKLKFDKYQFYTQISQQKTQQHSSNSKQTSSNQSKSKSKSKSKGNLNQLQIQNQNQMLSQNYIQDQKKKQKSEYEHEFEAIKKRIYSQMNRHQILQLSNHLKQEFIKLQNQIQQIQQRIAIHIQKNKIDPNYRRKGAQLTWVKQKQIFLNKNKVLMQNLKQLDQKKIKALLDLKTHQKYYKPQQLKEISQNNKVSKFKKNSLKTQAPQIQQPNFNKSIKQMNRSKSQMKFNHRNIKQKQVIKKSHILRLKTSINSHSGLNIDDQIKTQRSNKKRKVSFNVKRQMKSNQTQTKPYLNEENQYIQRFDFVGSLQLNNLDFDDRIITEGINSKTKMCIQQLSVYVCHKGISSIKAKYKQFPYQKKQQLLSIDSFHSFQLTNSYKLFQTNLPKNDHVKQIKLIYNKKMECIKKILIISKLNIRYQFGNQQSHFPSPLQKQLKLKSEQIFIALDIDKNEYPSYLMGNYKNFGTMNALAGLAVQINQQKI